VTIPVPKRNSVPGYDALNRLTQVSDPNVTYKYQFFYDNIGRLTSTSTKYSFLSRTLTTGYTYDAASNRVTMTDPETGVTNYGYDTLNRLTGLTPPTAISGAFGFTYDVDSRRTQLTRPNGVNSNYVYDLDSRLLSALHVKVGTLDGATYTYDAAGNRTTKINALNAVASTFSYDSIYELQQVTQGSLTPEQYTYDAVGNRLSGPIGSEAYSYNSSNELLTSPFCSNPYAYTYDANGNTQTETQPIANCSPTTFTLTYAWDFENRLTGITSSTTGAVGSYTYDPFGRRIQKVAGGVTTNYAYDGDSIIEELDASGSSVARYAQGLAIDEPLAMLRFGSTYFYQADGLGSVTSLSNSSGALSKTYIYDSFGNHAGGTGTLTNPFQYTAREFEPETGHYYYRARYYDTPTGRFLSEDPVRFVQAINFYPYVANDPVDLVDPTGLSAGPKEPRVGTHCYETDSCSILLGKMELLQKTIKSHSGWDWHVPAPRGGWRHAEEIANYWRAWANCQSIYLSKCAKQKCPEELRLEEEAARRMESFWKTILYGLPAIPIGYSLPVLAPVLGPILTENPAFAQ